MLLITNYSSIRSSLLAIATGGVGQQNAFPGLTGDVSNNSLGNFGSAFGINWGVESSFGANQNTSQMALFQQLIAQQSGAQGLTQNGDSNINALSGNKRSSQSSNEGSVKKQQTASL